MQNNKKQKEQGARFGQVCTYLIEQAKAKNNTELSSLLGYSSLSTFNGMKRGDFPVPQKLLGKIQMLDPKVNVDWIVSGEGAMLHKRSDVVSQQQMRKVDRFLAFLYSENIQIKVALEQLKWTRRAYDKAVREDLTLQQLADIEAVYPSLNMEWVLSGKGDMIKREEVVSLRTIKRILTEMEALKAKVNRLERYIKKQGGGR